MSDIFADMESLGLGVVKKENLFESEEQMKARQLRYLPPRKQEEMLERDLVLDKISTCPVCDRKFVAKVMKTGKAKFLSSDLDLRPRYEGIDQVKYDVYVCDHCGNAMLSKFFRPMTAAQVKMVKEKICAQIHLKEYHEDIYSYPQAMERYQIALACALARQAKNSERAYICLKMGWLYRGWREMLENPNQEEKGSVRQIEEYRSRERECLKNACEGLLYAREKEPFPICGMDAPTLDYLLAAVSYETDDLDTAGRLIGDLLTKGGANARTKDKARDLKDMIMEKKKKSNV